MADLLKFTPKDRQGDPDFPGIPALAHFYKPAACGKTTDMPMPVALCDDEGCPQFGTPHVCVEKLQP